VMFIKITHSKKSDPPNALNCVSNPPFNFNVAL